MLNGFTRQLVNRTTFPTKHILVCEDALDNQARIATKLNELFGCQGHVQVSFVAGGEMAAAIMQAGIPVDAILLDHDMPYGSGADLLSWMKEHGFAGKVKVLTFSGIPQNNERMMKLGADYLYWFKHEVMDGLADSLLQELTAVAVPA